MAMATKVAYAGILLGLAKAANLRPDIGTNLSTFLNESVTLTSYNESSVKHQVRPCRYQCLHYSIKHIFDARPYVLKYFTRQYLVLLSYI